MPCRKLRTRLPSPRPRLEYYKSAVRTQPVTFPSGEERLAGTLFTPQSRGPWPAVVLVHGLGSGGVAMEPVGRDLARLGMVALAFDQRGHGRSTDCYRGDSSDDILAAAAYLTTLSEIDPDRIAVMGHSSGAREAILACLRSSRLAALVCTSPLADGEGGAPTHAAESFFRRIRTKAGDDLYDYPRDGPLPWLEGWFLRGTSRLWSRLRGYRFRVRWQTTLARWGRLRAGVAIQEMAPRPLLIVHCQGDRAIPVQAAEILYQKASQPKELFLPPGGWHSTPLLPGRVRRAWTSWLAAQLVAEAKRGVAP